ncbi:diguanylate cyclase [Hylemonella gracilis str. Niagara R]|uniref:diguanylate cyclase n=1 Tax=Hylemonella gracilis str. Niagara R TaxID=1458275 RepID=A0A016XJF5_9BURK|nr:sensor domain-containing diguanylate cyclase [Hylemonella gracilis]EYC52224.1 diguanylate cyclase [Hylemonella gracilis str. Niagara R]
MNYSNRFFVCALLGLPLGAHLIDIDAPLWLWALLITQFYIYPHLLYWRARTARDQLRAEMPHLLLDCAASGAWAAGLGFPTWLSFVLFACNNINFVAFYGGHAGVPRLVGAMGLGAAVVWFSGLHYPLNPHTGVAATVLSMVALTLYLVAFGHTGHQRALAWRKSNLKLREQYQKINALQARLREQAVRDPLTGLYNRRHLGEVLEPELARCRAARSSLAVLLVDVDHFKCINDTRGHAVGDLVLQNLAQLMQRHVRAQDMVFRYGGEEFLLLLPDISLDTATQRAEALRTAFCQTPLRVSGKDTPPLTVTLSCGVAAFPLHADQGEALISCADQALYAAKRQGRNRTQVWPPMMHAACG